MLQRFAVSSYGPWYARHAAGIASFVVGFSALIAGYWTQFAADHAITQVPNPWITLPLLVISVAAGVISLARRERARPLAISGMAMAAAATVLGWVILVAAVAAVAVIAILIVAKFH